MILASWSKLSEKLEVQSARIFVGQAALQLVIKTCKNDIVLINNLKGTISDSLE